MTLSPLLPRDLGGGLRLRQARPEDTAALSSFNAGIHEDESVRDMTRSLMEDRLPGTSSTDFTVVEETATGKIVSSTVLISQVWEYEGQPFGVGRPELVGTLPEYRRRGLVRVQMDTLHAWSQARGHLVQAITGIPNYYRQFGYEMAVDLGGGRVSYKNHIPALPEGQGEPFRMRPADDADAPFLLERYQGLKQRSLLWCRRDEDLMRYEISGKLPTSATYTPLFVIESAAGEPVGMVSYLPNDFHGDLMTVLFELKPGTSYWEATPSVMRWLWAQGEQIKAKDPLAAVRFLGAQHPVALAYPERMPVARKPYAWYLRVPDLAAFITTIAPALERRLAGSVVEGYTGTLRITFFTSGLSLSFERGRLTAAANLPATDLSGVQAQFPGLTFLQVLFGHRTVDELRDAFPDCWVHEDKAGALVRTLFPRRASDIWMLD